MMFEWMEKSEWRVKSAAEGAAFLLERRKEGDTWHFLLRNTSRRPARVDEVVLFAGDHGLPPETMAYGEGSQMLSQYEGALDALTCITALSDAGHYRMPEAEGMATVYNLLLCYTQPRKVMYAFASCARFVGAIRVNGRRMEMALNLEGIEIGPGEAVPLEDVFVAQGEPPALFAALAEKLVKAHPPLPLKGAVPTGWCSWYCFGPTVTADDIAANMAAMKSDLPQLTYVQIDDGYQAYMGDWLVPHLKFGDLKQLLRGIQSAGFEPAIWVAPFIAEADSALFKGHPDWFVSGDDGRPLSSAKVSFGGWRNGPWYMLDGTHPGAQDYLEMVFRTFRLEYGIRYFKLDANMWGCMAHGRRHDPNATSVEAYRRGMAAVVRGAGEDSVLLGCNAPMWPSIGAVNCMRVSNDLMRSWDWSRIQTRECLRRNWQHGRLWVNDPDVVTLMNTEALQLGGDGSWAGEAAAFMTEGELRYHRTAMFATAGMVLVGDDMTRYDQKAFDLIKKMVPPHPLAAQFQDADMSVGTMPGGAAYYLCLFNDTDAERSFVQPCRAAKAYDHWTDEPIPISEGALRIQVPGRDAMLIRCEHE